MSANVTDGPHIRTLLARIAAQLDATDEFMAVSDALPHGGIGTTSDETIALKANAKIAQVADLLAIAISLLEDVAPATEQPLASPTRSRFGYGV